MYDKDSDIKVSVSVICYKHAKYLRKCLDAILAQKVDFKYEVLIGDDCSNDGSAEIIMEYKEKYPDIIVPFINEKNLGTSQNSWNLKVHCRGKYIASCEGDDFWINDQKMQKQVDFLESHPQYSAVATNTVNVDPEGLNPVINLFSWQTNKTYRLKHFLKYGMVIHGNSIMYRNSDIFLNENYKKLRFAEPTMGDIISRVMFYVEGPIFVLPDITHAHRNGIKDATSFTYQQKTRLIDYTKMYFRIVNNVTEFLDHKYNLEALKSNRLALVYYAIKRGGVKVEKKELQEIYNMISFKYRILARCKYIRNLSRRFLHKIVRKFFISRQTQEISKILE